MPLGRVMVVYLPPSVLPKVKQELFVASVTTVSPSVVFASILPPFTVMLFYIYCVSSALIFMLKRVMLPLGALVLISMVQSVRFIK